MKKLLLLLVLCTTVQAGFIAKLLDNEKYTYEALGAMVYYQTHCSVGLKNWMGLGGLVP